MIHGGIRQRTKERRLVRVLEKEGTETTADDGHWAPETMNGNKTDGRMVRGKIPERWESLKKERKRP